MGKRAAIEDGGRLKERERVHVMRTKLNAALRKRASERRQTKEDMAASLTDGA